MKNTIKKTGIIFVILLTMMLLSMSVSAAVEGDYEYTIYNDEAKITKYNGNDAIIVVPDTLGGCPVTDIGETFMALDMEEIVLPNTLHTICSYAFAGCDMLTSIVIPESVSDLRDMAFWRCVSLEKITILNPNCFIELDGLDGALQVFEHVIISSYVDSTAEELANLWGYHFLPLDGENAGIIQNHVYPSKWNEILPATCTERGLSIRICKICNEVESIVNSSLGHDMSEFVITTSATCKESGIETSKCSRCDKIDTKIIPLEKHVYVKQVVAPTCKTQGYTMYTCKCGDTYNGDYVNALNHKDSNTDNNCDYGCGYVFQESTPEKEKNFFEKIADWFKNLFSKLFGWLK